MKDAASVAWLGDQWHGAKTPAAVAQAAACALGKIGTPETHAALAKHLTEALLTSPAAVVGEALFSIGRFTAKDDIPGVALDCVEGRRDSPARGLGAVPAEIPPASRRS